MIHSLQPQLPFFRDNYPVSNFPYFLTLERTENIASLLKRFMQDHQPFLKKGYCIRDLAEEIGIPAYQVSAYINQLLGVNFNEYLNRFRIQYCLQLIQNGLVSSLNLRGLAYRCGFSNRNTLTTAFKKFTGLTPSEFTRTFEPGARVDDAERMNYTMTIYNANGNTI